MRLAHRGVRENTKPRPSDVFCKTWLSCLANLNLNGPLPRLPSWPIVCLSKVNPDCTEAEQAFIDDLPEDLWDNLSNNRAGISCSNLGLHAKCSGLSDRSASSNQVTILTHSTSYHGALGTSVIIHPPSDLLQMGCSNLSVKALVGYGLGYASQS